MFESADRLWEIGDEHWNIPNKEATNETGFTAVPGGRRRFQGSFVELGEKGNWWTSTEESEKKAEYFRIQFNVENDG
jgi:uncharacterized protein (TIGR02145 family)